MKSLFKLRHHTFSQHSCMQLCEGAKTDQDKLTIDPYELTATVEWSTLKLLARPRDALDAHETSVVEISKLIAICMSLAWSMVSIISWATWGCLTRCCINKGSKRFVKANNALLALRIAWSSVVDLSSTLPLGMTTASLLSSKGSVSLSRFLVSCLFLLTCILWEEEQKRWAARYLARQTLCWSLPPGSPSPYLSP